jgi:hypothetical protein
MESPDSHRIAVSLAHRVGQGADAAQIADAIVSAWQQIDVALNPIVGQRGVVMLYKRSLHLTGPAHPWLMGVHEGVQTAIDLAALKSVLSQQSNAHAAAGGGDLLQTFHELLASLIGPLLTERLLRPVWASFSTGPPAQDISP